MYGAKNSIFRSIPGRVSVGRLIAVFPTKKAGKIGATNLPPTFEAGKPNWSLFVECKDKNKNARCTSSKKLLNFENAGVRFGFSS